MTAEDSSTGFERAGAHRQRLRKIIADVIVVADGLKAASAQVMRVIDDRVASDAFRVMVVGEFKRGKSTLINAILGADVLPAYARPATAVLTELRWSATPTAVLYPIDGGPPVSVAVEALTEHITIPKGVRQGAADTSPWKLAEVGWPLEILHGGVVLIDSPGLNEDPVRQEVTLQNLSRADAIVFVQDCQQPVSIEEVRFMDIYLDSYDVFFVFNKINHIPAEQVGEVKDDILFRLGQHRDDQHRDRHYFVNGLAALQARIAMDATAWQGSGVAGFVDELSKFLASERHRAKLIGPAREASREIRLLRRTIPEQRALIDQTEAGLRQRYEEAKAPLRLLQDRAQQIRRELDLSQHEVESLVRVEVTNRMIRLSSEMPDIIADIVPEQELLLRPWQVKKTAEAYAEELSERAAAEAASRFKAWQKKEFAAVLEPKLTTIAHRADELFQEFMRDLAKVRERLTGLDLSGDDGLSGLDGDGRLAGGDLGGLTFVGGIAVRHIMGQIAATYAVALVWAFTPLGLIPLIVGVLIANSALAGMAKDKIERKVREEISAVLADKVRENAAQTADRSAKAVSGTLSSVIGDLMSRVEGELKQLRVQVEDALSALNEGEDAVKQRRERIAEWERVLEAAGNAIEDLIGDVALT